MAVSKFTEAEANRGMNLLAEAEAEDSAKSPFLGQTEAEAEDSVDHCFRLQLYYISCII